jgi:hypothetical protein
MDPLLELAPDDTFFQCLWQRGLGIDGSGGELLLAFLIN